MQAGIVGGGIMGKLIAFALVNANWDVTLFDHNKNNCSLVAAGMLSPIAELLTNPTLIFAMGLDAIDQHWPQILAQLQMPIYFSQKGSLVICANKDKTELLRYQQRLVSLLPDAKHMQRLTHEELSEKEIALRHFNSALFLPIEAQIDAQQIMSALDSYLQHKINLISQTIIKTAPHTITSQQKKYSVDLVVDCRGLGSAEHFGDVRSVRGELIHLHTKEISISRPIRFLHPHYNLYLVPRPDNRFIIGATEIESADHSNISVRSMLEMLTAVYAINKKFAEARILHSATQCRPTLPDNLPKIKYTPGFIAINGLYRHGFLLAPTLMHDVMNYVTAGFASLIYPTIWETYD